MAGENLVQIQWRRHSCLRMKTGNPWKPISDPKKKRQNWEKFKFVFTPKLTNWSSCCKPSSNHQKMEKISKDQCEQMQGKGQENVEEWEQICLVFLNKVLKNAEPLKTRRRWYLKWRTKAGEREREQLL